MLTDSAIFGNQYKSHALTGITFGNQYKLSTQVTLH